MSQTFRLSVSLMGGCKKPQGAEFNRINFRKEVLSLSQFEEYVRDGRTFAYCFDDGDKVFSITDKKKEKFRYTEVIVYDVDDSTVPMDKYVEGLPYKPTFAYTTYSNGVKGYRFRLVYVFDEPIVGHADYKKAYLIVAEANGLCLSDNCMKSAAQCFIGNGSGKVETYRSDYVYSLSDFPKQIKDDSECSDVCLIRNGKTDVYVSEDGDVPKVKYPSLDETFQNDLFAMSPLAFMEKYAEVYPYFDHNELILSEDEKYYTYPEDYYEIVRRWRRVEQEMGNGRIIKASKVLRWEDGEHRRRKLYMAARIMRAIKPDITLEHIVCNLVRERYYYYVNTDGQLTNAELIKAAKNALYYDGKLTPSKHPSYKVNKSYWAAQGVNAHTASNYIGRELRHKRIGELYDCSLSVKENLKALHEQGVKVGKSTLYNFCEKYGISTKGVRC